MSGSAASPILYSDLFVNGRFVKRFWDFTYAQYSIHNLQSYKLVCVGPHNNEVVRVFGRA